MYVFITDAGSRLEVYKEDRILRVIVNTLDVLSFVESFEFGLYFAFLANRMDNTYFYHFGHGHWTGYIYALYWIWHGYCIWRIIILVIVLYFFPLLSLTGHVRLLR